MPKKLNNTPYCPNRSFMESEGLIYLLQRSAGSMYKGKIPMCNDITLKICQQPSPRGLNKMPQEKLDAFIKHIHDAANQFLWEEFGLSKD